MGTKEIEVRFLNINKQSLLSKLRALGAEDKGESHLQEIIFYDQDLAWLNEGRFVRLRTIDEKTTLTYKKNKNQTIDSAYEIEFAVPDADKTTQFLESIGLVAFRHQEKRRHTLVLGDVIVDIDTWPQIPTYVEMEGPSPEKLCTVATSLGFDWSHAVFEDARSVLEKHYHIPIGTLRWFTFDRWE